MRNDWFGSGEGGKSPVRGQCTEFVVGSSKQTPRLISVVLVDKRFDLRRIHLLSQQQNRAVSRRFEVRMPAININIPMEKITVGDKRKMIQVITWGEDLYAIEMVKGKEAFIPHGFKCLTKYERRRWIAETMINENGQPLYRFTDVETAREGPWCFSPTGALQRANELVCNVFHGKGYNGRIVIGLSYPNPQQRIKRLIKSGHLRNVAEVGTAAVTSQPLTAPIVDDRPVAMLPTPDVAPQTPDGNLWNEFQLYVSPQFAHGPSRRQSLDSVFDDWVANLPEDDECEAERQSAVSPTTMDIEPLDVGFPCDQDEVIDVAPAEPLLLKKISFCKSASQTSFDELVFQEVVDEVIDGEDLPSVFGSSL